MKIRLRKYCSHPQNIRHNCWSFIFTNSVHDHHILKKRERNSLGKLCFPPYDFLKCFSLSCLIDLGKFSHRIYYMLFYIKEILFFHRIEERGRKCQSLCHRMSNTFANNVISETANKAPKYAFLTCYSQH